MVNPRTDLRRHATGVGIFGFKTEIRLEIVPGLSVVNNRVVNLDAVDILDLAFRHWRVGDVNDPGEGCRRVGCIVVRGFGAGALAILPT